MNEFTYYNPEPKRTNHKFIKLTVIILTVFFSFAVERARVEGMTDRFTVTAPRISLGYSAFLGIAKITAGVLGFVLFRRRQL